MKKVNYLEIAQIHATSINKGFLPTLGEKFLSLLYEAIDKDSNSALFIEVIDEEVVGFVSGGRNMKSVYRQLLKRWPKLLCVLLPTLLSPIKLKRIFEIIWLSGIQKPVPGNVTSELYTIAVLEKARRQGVAEQLYKSLMQWFIDQGEDSFCIVVGENLKSAQRFYQRMGAIPVAKIEVHHGAKSVLYLHKLTKSLKNA